MKQIFGVALFLSFYIAYLLKLQVETGKSS